MTVCFALIRIRTTHVPAERFERIQAARRLLLASSLTSWAPIPALRRVCIFVCGLGCIWVRFGLYLGMVWTVFGLYLDCIWIAFGLYLDMVLIVLGYDLDMVWAVFGLYLGCYLGRPQITDHPPLVLVGAHCLVQSRDPTVEAIQKG